jgi:hypothetical protein
MYNNAINAFLQHVAHSSAGFWMLSVLEQPLSARKATNLLNLFKLTQWSKDLEKPIAG